jgi:hypothetical protein
MYRYLKENTRMQLEMGFAVLVTMKMKLKG